MADVLQDRFGVAAFRINEAPAVQRPGRAGLQEVQDHFALLRLAALPHGDIGVLALRRDLKHLHVAAELGSAAENQPKRRGLRRCIHHSAIAADEINARAIRDNEVVQRRIEFHPHLAAKPVY